MGDGQKTIADNQAWNAESTAGGWDGLVGEYCDKTWKGYAATPLASCAMPKVTETGWPSTSITQDQQGKLITNVYLSAAKLGWQNTVGYPLFDNRRRATQAAASSPVRRHGQRQAEAVGNLCAQHDRRSSMTRR